MPVERQSVSEVVTPSKHTSNINYLYNGPQLKETVTIIFLRLVSNLDKAFFENERGNCHLSYILVVGDKFVAPPPHQTTLDSPRSPTAHTKPNWEPVRRLKKSQKLQIRWLAFTARIQ